MNLMGYLPEDYQKSKPSIEIQNAYERLLVRVGNDIADFENQLLVDTATWGLELWEWIYGIETDLTKSNEARRSVIKAKMRGSGTTTVSLIKSVSESYVGEVRVEEVNAEYKFIIYMVETIGEPAQINELKKTIREIKPAHLDFEIVYRYNTHGDLKIYTHGQLKNTGYTHEEIRCRKLPPQEEIHL